MFKIGKKEKQFLLTHHGLNKFKMFSYYMEEKTRWQYEVKLIWALRLMRMINSLNLGYTFLLNCSTIGCRSSKKKAIFDSMLDIEYILECYIVQKVILILNYITKLGIIPIILDWIDAFQWQIMGKRPWSHMRSKLAVRRLWRVEIRNDVDLLTKCYHK